jgi:hypothetical protein
MKQSTLKQNTLFHVTSMLQCERWCMPTLTTLAPAALSCRHVDTDMFQAVRLMYERLYEQFQGQFVLPSVQARTAFTYASTHLAHDIPVQCELLGGATRFPAAGKL